MARRSEDWNVGLARDLQDPKFAREFLLGAVEEGVPVQVALGKVIRATGVKEFAAKVRMASPNVLRAINPRHNPTATRQYSRRCSRGATESGVHAARRNRFPGVRLML